MDKELLKDTQILVENEENITFSKEKVTQTLCPQKLWDSRENVGKVSVQHVTYFSNTTACERGSNIMLPPNYNVDNKYPVLYFLHGIFGDEYSMINDPNNRLDILVENMLDEKLIKDMIVVFPNMFATGDPELKPGFNMEQTLPYDNFINDLTNDLIPFIEKNYSTLTDRENRAIVGFSMGGRETLYIGLQRSDLFAYICGISSAPGLVPSEDNFMKHEGQLSEDEMVLKCTDCEPELIIDCCGTKDSVVGKFPLKYHEIFERNNVKHLWYEVPEADHDSNAIRSGFYNLLIRWFNK